MKQRVFLNAFILRGKNHVRREGGAEATVVELKVFHD
jgi:hypothetical protein